MVVLSVFWKFISPAPSQPAGSYDELHASLNQLIVRKGIPEAISIVRSALEARTIDVNQCHSLLHQVGHSAFEFHRNDWEILTVEKTHICMDGYWHGVEAQMAMDWPSDPDGAARNLRKYCQKLREIDKTASCYHGAGHAFIQRYGNVLPVALGKCDELVLPDDDPNDCYRGVLSEYRNYLMAYDGDNEVPIAGGTPMVPEFRHTFDECASLAPKYRDACVSQFAGFLVTDDLDQAVSSCKFFDGWIHRRCAHTITTSYVSNAFGTLKTIMAPSRMSSFSREMRLGVIDGMYEGLTIFGKENLKSVWASFCSELTIVSDIGYCQRKLQ